MYFSCVFSFIFHFVVVKNCKSCVVYRNNIIFPHFESALKLWLTRGYKKFMWATIYFLHWTVLLESKGRGNSSIKDNGVSLVQLIIPGSCCEQALRWNFNLPSVIIIPPSVKVYCLSCLFSQLGLQTKSQLS